MHQEEAALAAVHDGLRRLDCLSGGHVRVLGHDIGRHGIAVGRDEAGDDEQKGPQEDLELHPQHAAQLRAEAF